MPQSSDLQVEAIVVSTLSHTSFRVETDSGRNMIASLSSEMRMSAIQILPGDKVLIEFSPYDVSKGRIISKDTEGNKI